MTMKIELGRARVNMENTSQKVVVATDASKGSKGSLVLVKKGKEIGEIVLEWVPFSKTLSSLSSAGNGTKIYLVETGFYIGNSTVRSYEQETYYFLIDQNSVKYFDSQSELAAAIWENSEEEIARAKEVRESSRHDAEYQKYAIAASEFVDINELPALEGSSKQIKWAETLRLKQIAAIGKLLKGLQADQEEFEDFVGNLNWALSKDGITEQTSEFVMDGLNELILSLVKCKIATDFIDDQKNFDSDNRIYAYAKEKLKSKAKNRTTS